jgi:N-acetylglucosaminyl-diphospho-decaprenol L-rhamnosyltransferase
MDISVSAIIVSHNSENVLPRCCDSLLNQTHQLRRILLVDSGSLDPRYLKIYQDIPNVTLLKTENIGFAQANNRGYAQRPQDTDFVLFLNPDAFLSRSFIEQAVASMQAHPKAGIISGKILWFDFEHDDITTTIDSTGIFRRWYGRWYDRGQGQEDLGQFDHPEEVQAVCGAVMFCRCCALTEDGSQNVFDPDFFLYKEDIELGLRLRKNGWKLLYLPSLRAYHGRGWGKDRKKIPLTLRRLAAGNELLLYKKHPSPYMVWAILKYFLVRFMRI